MARLSHTRTSRTVVTIVVLSITAVAAIEFYRTKTKSVAVAPKAAPDVLTVSPKPQPVTPPAVIAPAQPAIVPVITQTPDPTRPAGNPPTLWATNTNPPPAPVSNVPGGSPTVIGSTPAGTNSTGSNFTGTPPAGRPAAPAAKLVSDTQLPATSDLLAHAKAQVDAGDYLSARKQLNDALLTGTLSGADTDLVKKQIAEINQTLVFSPRPFPKDPLGGVYQVRAGEKLASIGNSHGVPFELLMSINRMTDSRKLRYGQTLKIINGPFHVVVSKSKFTLDLYLGSPAGQDSTYITTFAVGLGTENSTPTGSWVIKNKVTHPAYFPPDGHPGGVLDPADPKNPLGPYWLGLEGTDGQAIGQRSYGIHGTIDPNSIGKQSSMGCIRLHNEDVEVVYKMLVPGKSTVVVKD